MDIIIKNRVVAFLDLLGFRNYTVDNPSGARMMLGNYFDILNTKIIDLKLHPSQSYSDERLKNLAMQGSIDSFEYFLPFSDSIFIVSNNLNDFLKQLSGLLIDCYLYTANEYIGENKRGKPLEVRSKRYIRRANVYIEFILPSEMWYPLLFRVGIAKGDVQVISSRQINGFEFCDTINLLGESVVKSVKLEQYGKGPRVFCDNQICLCSEISDLEQSRFVKLDEEVCELLWPMYLFYDEDDRIAIHELSTPLMSVLSLWKFYRNSEYGEHYWRFLILLVKSALTYFNSRNYGDETLYYISERAKMTMNKDEIMQLINESQT